MTPSQVILVKDSFERVAEQPEVVADLFYTRLFALEPRLRPLFKGDMREQGRKLMQMIGIAVRSLDRPEAIVPAVQALGVRHASYGVQDADYDVVGSALLWTLEQGLGSDFTPQTQAAWLASYTLLADVMKQAAHQGAAVAGPES
jgi:hemoglobin-like flavoprotein